MKGKSFVMLVWCRIIFGGGAVGLFWWAYATVVREESVAPLTDLGIRGETLSRDEVDSYIKQLGDHFHAQNAARNVSTSLRQPPVVN
jgi:hypothetical protein